MTKSILLTYERCERSVLPRVVVWKTDRCCVYGGYAWTHDTSKAHALALADITESEPRPTNLTAVCMRKNAKYVRREVLKS